MKKPTAFILFFVTLFTALIVSVFSSDTDAPLLSSARGNPCVVVNHVVYEAMPDGSYNVCSLFDSAETLQTAKTITVRSEINGASVKSLETGLLMERELWEVSPLFDLGGMSQREAVCKRIILPDSIERIGVNAFFGMKHLRKINLPASLQSIGGQAFRECQALCSIAIPAKVKAIGEGAFRFCTALKRVEFPDGLKSIGRFAFQNCALLQNVSLPDTLTSLKAYAFFDCPIISAAIPANCVLGKYCFGSALKRLTFADQTAPFQMPNTIRTLPGLETVVLPLHAKHITISDLAFSGCTALKKIVNTEKITVIGKKAFKGCAALNSFTLSAKIKSVGAGAFAGTGLKKLIVSGTKKAFLSGNGNAFLKTIPANCKIYVKNNKMKNAFVDAGWQGKILINEKLA